MLVDCHCHLSFPQFKEDLDEIVGRAQEKEVIAVNSCVSPEEVEPALNLSERFENVHTAIGLSATNLEEEKVCETQRIIRENKDRIIGLGEVGLDYHWVKKPGDHNTLKENFTRFIELSIELDLPIIVHSRDAEEDCIRMLEEAGKPALLHCFSGSIEQALHATSFGCVISIPTNVTYVKSRQRLVEGLPFESIVLETDAPYLSPEPKTRNEPVNVVKSCEKLSDIKQVSLEEVALQTTETARKFYRI